MFLIIGKNDDFYKANKTAFPPVFLNHLSVIVKYT